MVTDWFDLTCRADNPIKRFLRPLEQEKEFALAVKANLSVQLFADSVLVAESDDQHLWRTVLNAIQTGKEPTGSPIARPSSEPAGYGGAFEGRPPQDLGPVASLAAELGIPEEEVTGACGPRQESPFIQLDERYWEALRSKTGSRGIDAIAPVALAATLLCLWFKHAKIDGSPTVPQCQAVLETIGLRDKNPSRSLSNADWLQCRGGRVQINPAQWSLAVRTAKAYCLKKSPKEIQGDGIR